MNNYPHIRLGEIATGTSLRNRSQALPVYAVTKHQGFVLNSEYFKKSTHSNDTSKYKVAKKGHFAYATIHLDEGSIGIAPEDAAISPMYTTFKVDESRVYPDFLVRYLKGENALAQYSLLGKGSAERRRSISFKSLQELIVPLPPLDEQRRIAAILDSAMELGELLGVKAHELNELERSSYIFHFGESTPTSKVEDLAERRKGSIRTGPFGSELLHNEFTDSGIAVLGLDNVVSNEFKTGKSRFISRSKFQDLKRYEVFPGDVLISIMGTTGRCAIVPGNIPTSINTKHICAVSPNIDEILPEFMRATFLWHPKVRKTLRQQTKGAIMAGLNMTIIKKLDFPVPPMVDQLRWAEQSKSVTTARSFVEAQRVAAEDLYTSLATRAFAGEL